MKTILKQNKRLICLSLAIILIVSQMFSFIFGFSVIQANAMPFYDLHPSFLTTRASFCTSYSSSTAERKHNIILASKSIDKTFIDVGGEFSFNLVVGERTEKKGYKKSKIIINGEFADGIGGGVCQVSTTLYNAVLLAGLEIIEYHPHSLPVSYVAPSFDAMVNSGYADLKFRNNTKNPIIIRVFADENKINVVILGQKMFEKYERESVIIKIISPLQEEMFDEKNEYPDIFKGESKQVKFGKEGYISQGYLIKTIGNSKTKTKIRQDKYNATRGLIVYGNAEKPTEESKEVETIG